ncbi:MAG: ATP-dependent DNA helicase RecG [Candidatus Omnitrophota bacterium]
MRDISSPVKFLKGVGPARAKSLQRLGIQTVEDLLYFFPRRYEDRKQFTQIAKLEEKSTCTIKAEIISIHFHASFKRRNFNIISASVADDSGKIDAVWFNQRFLLNVLKEGQELILFGDVSSYKGKLQISSPEFEIIGEDKEQRDNLNVGRIVPIYSLAYNLSQRQIRRIVKNILDEFIPRVRDFLPYALRNRLNLFNLAKALINIHFPQSFQVLDEAYRRLSFDDCFLYQIPILLKKVITKQRKAFSLQSSQECLNEILNSLEFKLTASQLKVLDEIRNDLAKPVPMQRLLQGDVGSGKTVVAFLASLIAAKSGSQVAFMVPTEIIAKQHYKNIKYQILNIKNKTKDIRIAFLTSSLKKDEKNRIYRAVKEGRIDLLIGTHALLSEGLVFKKLGLIIIDEQHKFGVEQRAQLARKSRTKEGEFSPHCLIMTATPIPRTLAMTIYGDLDVSVINELPLGRKPLTTLAFSREESIKAYEFLKKIVSEGKQAYIIYPIIEESEAMDLKAAQASFKELKETHFKDFRIALIHSRIEESEQDEIMDDFYKRKIDILVATSILEVGVDAPSAACILIEEADRFGLSTLHQLRGRVGRSTEPGYCLLVSSERTEDGRKRIRAIMNISDGFKIAEADLRIRGPGQFFGRQQHGLSDLRIVDPLRQMHILKSAREEAMRLLALDPALTFSQNSYLKEILKKRFPGFETLMMTA